MPKLARAFLLLLALAAAAGLWSVRDQIDLLQLRGLVQAAGGWGVAGFLLAFALLQPMGVSGWLFLLTAGAIWPAWMALPLAWVGTMASSLVGFLFARYVGQEWVQRWIPARVQRYDARLEADGLRTVVLLRLVFFNSFFIHLFCGLSRVRARDYMLGTAVGNLPLMTAAVLLADRISAWFLS